MIKGMTARQVARLLMVCGVGNGECRGQVTRIQERKTRPMLAVCQLKDVRGGCEAGRGSGWRALCWKGEDERGDGSGRRRMLIRGRWSQSRRSCLTAGVTGLAAPGFPKSLGVTARQVARLLSLAGGVRGRERGMQGPGDPGEEATHDARSVSAHGRAGGVRGRQRELMERTLLEMRGRAQRRLGEAQDADQGEMVTEVMPGGGRTADSHQTGLPQPPLLL